jgi:hypothetical protein
MPGKRRILAEKPWPALEQFCASDRLKANVTAERVCVYTHTSHFALFVEIVLRVTNHSRRAEEERRNTEKSLAHASDCD